MKPDQTDCAIRSATPSDLAEILSWLKTECDGSSGFYGNRNMIESGQADDNLSVVVTGAKRIAGFLLASDSSMDIIQIRPEFQRRGIGRLLAEHGLHRIEVSGQI